MNKLNKIFSIVLTAAIATSLLVFAAAPVSAANNYWDQLAIPSKTNQVMADNIVSSGLLTTAINGDLYAYVKTTSATVPYQLAKSTNSGRAWTYVSAPDQTQAITAIATSPSEANVVYFAQGLAVYKSIDSGATFTLVASVPSGTVKALGVALLGGSYKIFAGTNTGTYAGNVYVLNEAAFPRVFSAWDPAFTGMDVVALKLSPAFATDNGIIAVATTAAAGTNVLLSTGGSVFNIALKPVNIAVNAATTAAIAFPSEFAIPSNAVFYVGLGDGAGASANVGVYRVAAQPTTSTALTSADKLVAGDIVSLASTGSYAGTGTVLAGTEAAGVMFSTASGIGTWGTVSRQPTGTGQTFVAMKSDYATSTTAFALRAAGAVDDESGFFMTTDANKDWNGIALLNSSIAAIDPQVAVASTGDSFMITTNTAGTAKSLWRYFGGNWERTVTGSAATDLTKVAVSPNYATDKYVFFYNGTTGKFSYSSNNGLSFTAQTAAVGAVVNDYEVLDSQTMVVATSAGIFKSANNGLLWGAAVNAQVASMIVRSSDGTTLVGNVGGALIKSTDLGTTWTTASTDAAQILAGITGLTFQNGSNNVLWATTALGLFSIDLSAATVAWDTANRAGASSGVVLDQPALAFTNGTSVVAGIAPAGKYVVYALGTNTGTATIARKNSFGATNNQAGTIAMPTTVTSTTGLFIQPAVGANKLWLIGTTATGAAIFTLTDQLEAAVAGVAIGSFTTTSAVVNWTAMAGADQYLVNVADASVVTAALSNPYSTSNIYVNNSVTATATVTGTTATFSSLAANTTYYVSVWAIRTTDGTNEFSRVSYAGSVTFSTQPSVPTAPNNLVPAAGSINVPVTPAFQWAPVAGATKYELQVSTTSAFTTLVGTTVTTTAPVYAWTTPALSNSTDYYWRVRAITATGTSDYVTSIFTTGAAVTTPPVTSTQPPITITNTSVVVTNASTETPGYVWAIIGIGALLVIVVIVLIVRTRRVA